MISKNRVTLGMDTGQENDTQFNGRRMFHRNLLIFAIVLAERFMN